MSNESQLVPTYHGETQIAGWGETHSGGRKVTFWFTEDDPQFEVFKTITRRDGHKAGQRFMMALVQIGDDDKPMSPPVTPGTEKKAPNYFASKLHADGYFYALRLWLAMHDARLWTMQQHKQFVETLACCGQAFHPHQCNGDVVLHHAHRAEDPAAGDRQPENPQKAPHYFGIPACHTAHTWIHTQADRETKRLIREYAIKLTADQMKTALKHHLKITSLSDITPEMLKAFEVEIGL